MRILVIDDEPFAGGFLRRQLETLGRGDVTVYESARDALARIDGKDDVDLIFCDLQMPEMDGVEFVRQLVRIGYDGAIALVSGEEDRILHSAERLARAHRLKVLGALAKPVLPERLRRLLEDDLAVGGSQASAAGRAYGGEELRRAIAQGELVNHYQPKVELATGAVVGVEALVRWNHPDGGLVMPDRFVPVAEDEGVIDELTRTVLENAVRDAARWESDGLALYVSVNVSMDNLGAVDFPDLVVEAASRAGFPSSRLILEITESRLMRDAVAALDILTRLRLKRVGLSIDDFGTGHSSLSQLRDLPFNELKIDRGFVHGAGRSASLGAMLEANLNMARRLGLATVAEGVEDRDDWDFLAANGCDLAQGWFVGRAMPPEALPDWAAAWELRRPTPRGGAR